MKVICLYAAHLASQELLRDRGAAGATPCLPEANVQPAMGLQL